MIITIDGHAGSGKSTIARLLAEHLSYIYLNTGKMYRCLTAFLLTHHTPLLDPSNSKALQELLPSLKVAFTFTEQELQILIEGDDFAKELQAPATLEWVSRVASWPFVRALVRTWQLRIAQLVSEEGKGLVAEGRDMGSVIFPRAQKKYYFTAEAPIRAQRRFLQLEAKGELQGRSVESILEEIIRRDREDSERKHSPLVKPQGAKEIDTSRRAIEEVMEELVADVAS